MTEKKRMLRLYRMCTYMSGEMYYHAGRYRGVSISGD